MTKIQAVVFDIGNVLISWQPEQFYDAVIGPENRKKLFADIDLHAMNERVDLGADFTQTIYDTAEKYPQWQAEIRLWHDRWIDIAQPAIGHSVKLLRALKTKDVPVFALSNFGIGSFEYAKTFYDFLDEFDRSYISGYMGVTKPSPEIYQQVEEDSGITPSRLLFADDRIENIQAADARGWNTHHFDAPLGLADRLVAEGLLNQAEAKP
ncbi:MAG: HAD family phosphatase [Paracoccaceae bacterium]